MKKDLSWLATPEAQEALQDPMASLFDPRATAVYSCAGPGQLVIEAIMHGLKLPITSPKDFQLNKTAIIWGILRGSGVIMRSCEKHRNPFWFADHGYFLRGHSGYGPGPGRHNRLQFYRIVKNAMQHTTVEDRPSDRFEYLKRVGGA